jgi:hypothetical protein
MNCIFRHDPTSDKPYRYICDACLRPWIFNELKTAENLRRPCNNSASIPNLPSIRRLQSESLRGPGTELSKLLAKIGIKANEGCKCKARSEEMDRRGVKWCENNLELIVDWLEEEATKRHLPFLRTAGKILVKRAIHNAKRQSKERLKHQDDPIQQLRNEFEMHPTDEAYTNGS